MNSTCRPSHYEEDLQRRIRSLPALLATRMPAPRANFPSGIRHFAPRSAPRRTAAGQDSLTPPSQSSTPDFAGRPEHANQDLLDPQRCHCLCTVLGVGSPAGMGWWMRLDRSAALIPFRHSWFSAYRLVGYGRRVPYPARSASAARQRPRADPSSVDPAVDIAERGQEGAVAEQGGRDLGELDVVVLGVAPQDRERTIGIDIDIAPSAPLGLCRPGCAIPSPEISFLRRADLDSRDRPIPGVQGAHRRGPQQEPLPYRRRRRSLVRISANDLSDPE